MSTSLAALERILLTLWIGGLWVSGFLVAPLLFAGLEERAQAGTLAGTLFSAMSYLGLGCGGVLLAIHWLRNRPHRFSGWRPVVLAIMLLLVLAGEFVLAPMIAQLRSQGLTDSIRFGQLHGLASGVYAINCVLGLMLVAGKAQDS
ncbi:MAG: DUF4149 domain-containing protein [Gammaproteobacteria bacterium]|jgi:hypothetical protein